MLAAAAENPTAIASSSKLAADVTALETAYNVVALRNKELYQLAEASRQRQSKLQVDVAKKESSFSLDVNSFAPIVNVRELRQQLKYMLDTSARRELPLQKAEIRR